MAKIATLSGTCYALSEYPKGRALYVLRGGKWDKQAKAYTVPATPGNTRALALLGYGVPAVPSSVLPSTSAAPVVAVERPLLRLPLAKFMRSYQVEGVLKIEAWRGRVLLADSMGLGKSLQALAWASAHPEARPVVVVCPSCAKLNWADEIAKWQLKERVVVLIGTKPVPTWTEPPTLLIVNYDIVFHWLVVLQSLKPKLVIIDEAQRIRNWHATGKRKKADPFGRKQNFNISTDAVLRLCKGVPHVLALSGTPLVGRPMDLFTSLHMLRPDVFKSKFEFGMEFCDPKLDPWSGKLEYKGCTHPEKLNALLTSTCMIRRLKENVLLELPPKQTSIVHLETANRGEYEKTEADLEGDPLAKLTHLRQMAAQCKLASAMEWIDTFLESGQKLLLFVHHRAIGEAIAAKYGSICVSYNGGMSETVRWANVKRFQEDPTCKVFNGSITACGVALNLTAASHVAVLELPWTKVDLDQATDRAHRIGQKNCVNVYLLCAPDSIDEDMLEILAHKAGVSGAVLDNSLDQQAAMRVVLRSLRNRVANRLGGFKATGNAILAPERGGG